MEIKRLSEEIKQLTAPLHQALEKTIVSVIRRIESLADYQRLLTVFYGYYKPVEEKIFLQLQQTGVRQSVLLEKDICQLNPELTIVPFCNALPKVETKAAALGALYVLEGSALGGRFILQMVRKKIHLDHGFADSFFTGHGSETENNWQGFRNMLERSMAPEQKETLLLAVNETFEQFKKWADLNYTYDQQSKL